MTAFWNIAQRSWVKATQLIKEQAARFAEAVEDRDKMLTFLANIAQRFHYGCLLNKRKTNPNAVDLLIGCSPCS